MASFDEREFALMQQMADDNRRAIEQLQRMHEDQRRIQVRTVITPRPEAYTAVRM